MMALFYGLTHWQIEIVYINICNGWATEWPFCIIWENPWAAKDFFYLLQFIFVAGLAAGMFLLGWEARENKGR